ncbi:hypothetical protein [Alienimonas sp. DA493]|uniref:hypothetical protein n=1 Tax=Alienimonas sp. DA493 TaxID=3373605 RepID=UPI0037548E52
MSASSRPLFPLGQTVATPAALGLLQDHGRTPIEFLTRHRSGDWGDLCAEDRTTNEQALADGCRILSAYNLGDGNSKVWIITEADRSCTTVLLPDEY